MGGKHHGGRHDKMARMQNMTPEQIQATCSSATTGLKIRPRRRSS